MVHDFPPAAPGEGTLTYVVNQIDNLTGVAGAPYIISFDPSAPSSPVVTVPSTLPTITKPVIIDGTLPVGRIQLDGTAATGPVLKISYTGATSTLGSTIKNLIVENSKGDGIDLSDAGSNSIISDEFSTNAGIGLDLSGDGGQDTISGTTFQGNGGGGLKLSASGKNTLSSDTFANNGTNAAELTLPGNNKQPERRQLHIRQGRPRPPRQQRLDHGRHLRDPGRRDRRGRDLRE